MKKSLFFLLASLCAVSASALTVSPAVKIDTDGPAHNPVLSPDGKTMLFSSDNHTGLKAMTIGQSVITTLDDAPGAGFNPIFSSDGKTVVYQTASLVDGLLNRDVRSYDLSTGKIAQLAPMSRNQIRLSDISGRPDYVEAEIEGITVASAGKVETIRPIKDAHSYLWASLSPDGNRIAFVEPFQGVFVCNLDGSEPVKVAAKGAFPSWAGENLITYTLSHDDGYVILDSTLQIHDLTTGITVNLTSDDIKVGESTSAANGTVVYSTLEGDVYMITVK